MRMAVTANLRIADIEEQAEFDSPETIEFILENLQQLGHQAELIELTRPLSVVISDFEKYKPDLLFNTSEGTRGKLREAFWPGVFEELKLPYTGSDPYTLALSLDKNLTKYIVSRHGVPTPKAELVTSYNSPNFENFTFPMIAKPNFEGSSKGITQSSIVENPNELKLKINESIKKYPEGILVEEYIEGRDITIPFLENLAEPILDAVEYIVDPELAKQRRYQIYDYELKNDYYDSISIKIAELNPIIKETIRCAALGVVKSLNCQDFGRMDFRLNSQGEIYFLEINCLPYLDPGVSLYLSAANRGLKPLDVFKQIIQSALKRYNLSQ